MNKYARVFSIGLQNTLVYRWNFFLRSLFDVVPLIGAVFLWRAIYAARSEPIGGYEFGAMIYYFLLTLLADNLIRPTDDEWQIAEDIREGQINSLLTKPVDYLTYRIGLFLGYRVTFSFFTLPIVLLIFACFYRYISLPHNIMTWFFAVISLAMAGMLQFFIAYAIAMLAFWILEISTVVFIIFSFEYFLSGHLFPLDIMPRWLLGVLAWLPFTYELYFPVAVFQGKVVGDALYKGLLIQAGWVLAAWALGRWMWNRGLRKFQAVGG